MTDVAAENLGFVGCWNEILTPKWIRFRHLLSGNGKLHSDVAMPRFGIRPGQRVLDFGCGFGETTLELGRLVGPSGSVLGLDCTSSFVEIATRERDRARVANVRGMGRGQGHRAPVPAPAGRRGRDVRSGPVLVGRRRNGSEHASRRGLHRDRSLRAE